MAGIENKASRESSWDELDEAGKIKRMRRVIKEQNSTITRMTKYLNLLIDHDHLNGKLVSNIKHPNSESYGDFHFGERSDEWF